MARNFLYVNGRAMPQPKKPLTIEGQQGVDGQRNSQNIEIAQKINRRIIKFSNLEWPYLTDKEWSIILNEVEKFNAVVTYWDTRLQGYYQIECYWGDSSSEPYEVDSNGKIISHYNCKCNLIDSGKPLRKVYI